MNTSTPLVAVASLALGAAIAFVVTTEAPVEPQADPTPQATASAAAARRAPQVADGPVRVAGIMSQRVLAREGEYGEQRPFAGSFGTTRVALEVDLDRVQGAGALSIVDVVLDRSTVERFFDDRGTDLTAGLEPGNAYEMMPDLSQDGRRVSAILGAETRPARDAGWFAIEGSIALLCASGKEIRTSQPVALQAGSRLAVEPFELEIVQVGPSQWDESQWTVELRTHGDLSVVTSWSLVKPDGEVVELSEQMTWTMNGTVQKTLAAPAPVETAALRVELWVDGEVLMVPYAVEAGLGL